MVHYFDLCDNMLVNIIYSLMFVDWKPMCTFILCSQFPTVLKKLQKKYFTMHF